MENSKKEQYEALETLADFNKKVVQNMKILVKELSGERLEDTDKLLDSVVSALNWEIQVMNGTMEVLNEGKERVNKEEVNVKITALGNAIATKEDSKIADAMSEVVPVLEALDDMLKEVLAA